MAHKQAWKYQIVLYLGELTLAKIIVQFLYMVSIFQIRGMLPFSQNLFLFLIKLSYLSFLLADILAKVLEELKSNTRSEEVRNLVDICLEALIIFRKYDCESNKPVQVFRKHLLFQCEI